MWKEYGSAVVLVALVSFLFGFGFLCGYLPDRLSNKADNPNDWECPCGPCATFCSPTEYEESYEEAIVKLVSEISEYQGSWYECQEELDYYADLMLRFCPGDPDIPCAVLLEYRDAELEMMVEEQKVSDRLYEDLWERREEAVRRREKE